MYYQIFHTGNVIFYICMAVSVVLLMQKIIYHIIGLFPSKRCPPAKKNHKYAILIPARNESRVIEQLLISIKEQDYDQNLLETYIIVESSSDPTCEIAKKYANTHVFVRQHLELKGKGHALDEVIQHIFASGKKYEAFFICDADNVLSKTFISEMNRSYDAGFQIALGYRNSKNWNDGWIASGSALTFSMFNTFQNKCRSKFNQKVILSGTGFYIASEILEKLGGWKFFELVEDVELSMHAIVTNIKSTYNEYAEFYDEQPSKIKASWNQRIRWVKGFTTVQSKYRKRLFKGFLFDKENKLTKYEYTVNILPVICILASTIIYSLFNLVLGIVGAVNEEPYCAKVFSAFAIAVSVIYLFFVFYAGLMLFAERKHTNITAWNSIVCCVMFPIYMAMYIPIFVESMFKKEVEWKPIVHSVTMMDNETVELRLEESRSARENEEPKTSILKNERTIMKPISSEVEIEEDMENNSIQEKTP